MDFADYRYKFVSRWEKTLLFPKIWRLSNLYLSGHLVVGQDFHSLIWDFRASIPGKPTNPDPQNILYVILQRLLFPQILREFKPNMTNSPLALDANFVIYFLSQYT